MRLDPKGARTTPLDVVQQQQKNQKPLDEAMFTNMGSQSRYSISNELAQVFWFAWLNKIWIQR